MATKTLVLTPGECVIFPSNIKIQAIVPTGDITVTSTCEDILPETSGYKCWQFKWEGNNLGDYNDAAMTHIKIGDTEYPLTDIPETNYWDNDGNFLENSIPISVPAGLCLVVCNSGGVDVSPKSVVVRVPTYLGMPLIRFTNPSFENGYLIPYEDICDCA